MCYLSASGMFSWSPGEWGLFLTIFAGGLSGVLAVVLKFIQNIKTEIIEIRTAMRSTATDATEAKTASTLNTAAVGNIRRDLTVVGLAVPTAETIAAAVSSAVSPTPQPTNPTNPTQPVLLQK